MARIGMGVLLAAVPAALLAAAPPPGPVPQGLLPDAARPVAYRLDLTIVPSEPRFRGHAEIDVVLKAPTASLYLHGRDLKMAQAVARAGGMATKARYREVDRLGVARLDFETPLPAGKATLVFDYDAPFADSAAGLFHVKVGDHYYAWTQFESIDARAAFPGFDQPGYKTPFAVSVTTKADFATYANAAEVRAEPAGGGLVRHVFAETRPLPTYLVAFGAGPFAVAAGAAAPTPERAQPLPVRVIGTQPNKDKLDYALRNTGPIVGLLERYFGRAFPFPKLDQVGTPILQGAMENAGADTYGDTILFLDAGASTAQKQAFGMVVSHELAHQWFGDLVTPAWWDDLWLNESFANWMGFRIGDAWQPDLKIGVGALAEGYRAMSVDALAAGRPIHQPIRTNAEIDSAFDAVTYGKGGQVVAMIAAYLGDAKFRDGVRLHLDRRAYGNATTEQFFAALAEAAHDPRVLVALRSFVDQQGVPVVRVERTARGLAVTQRRYAMLGTTVPPARWTIPLCLRVGAARRCTLLDKPSAVLPGGAGAIMPNADGTGYYRFSLPEAEWRTLIAGAASLPPGEALALGDSLWAAYRAGEAAPALLVEAARTLARNPYSGAAVDGGGRLAGLRARGLVPEAGMPGYRALIDQIYAPKLAALGFDPRAGAYAAEDPDRQQLRTRLVALLAEEAEDAALRARLTAAARAYLGGDKAALDQSLLGAAFAAYLASDLALAPTLFDQAVTSDDSLFRDAAIGAVGATGDGRTGQWVLAHLDDRRLRLKDRLGLLAGLVGEPATRDRGFDWLVAHYDEVVTQGGIFSAATLPGYGGAFCSVEKAAAIEAALRPKVDRYKRGALSLDRTVEQVRDCGVLKQARGAEVAALFAR